MIDNVQVDYTGEGVTLYSFGVSFIHKGIIYYPSLSSRA